MRITFLVRNIWGIGGTIKTTLNTAHALVERGHQVTIASCIRTKERPDFDIDPRIRIESLWDVRAPELGGERLPLLDKVNRRRASYLDADRVNNMGESSRLLDRRVKRFLGRLDTDVLVGTQVALNLYIARYGAPGCAVVAQEHLYLDSYKPPVRARILAEYHRFDAIVSITEADARVWREALPEAADRVECIPNAIPPHPHAETESGGPVIMAAGRLTGMKGFDVLVEAFARIADRHPDWNVRIFGRGRGRKKLLSLIDRHGMRERVQLMGPVTPLDDQWTQASLAVVPSRFEPFGLVIVEAMAAGVPVVATAVPHGPLELIDDQVNGVLVKPKSPARLAEAMELLIEDEELRGKLADAGRRTAARFEPQEIVGQHLELFDRLLAARG